MFKKFEIKLLSLPAISRFSRYIMAKTRSAATSSFYRLELVVAGISWFNLGVVY